MCCFFWIGLMYSVNTIQFAELYFSGSWRPEGWEHAGPAQRKRAPSAAIVFHIANNEWKHDDRSLFILDTNLHRKNRINILQSLPIPYTTDAEPKRPLSLWVFSTRSWAQSIYYVIIQNHHSYQTHQKVLLQMKDKNGLKPISSLVWPYNIQRYLKPSVEKSRINFYWTI